MGMDWLVAPVGLVEAEVEEAAEAVVVYAMVWRSHTAVVSHPLQISR